MKVQSSRQLRPIPVPVDPSIDSAVTVYRTADILVYLLHYSNKSDPVIDPVIDSIRDPVSRYPKFDLMRVAVP